MVLCVFVLLGVSVVRCMYWFIDYQDKNAFKLAVISTTVKFGSTFEHI